MSLVLLVMFAAPLLMFLGQMVGASVGFVTVMLFHCLRGLLRWFLLPWVRGFFQKKVVNDPAL